MSVVLGMTALGSYCRRAGGRGKEGAGDKPTGPRRATPAASQQGRGTNTHTHRKQTQTQESRCRHGLTQREITQEHVEGSTPEPAHADVTRRETDTDPESKGAHTSTSAHGQMCTPEQAQCSVVATPHELRKVGLPRLLQREQWPPAAGAPSPPKGRRPEVTPANTGGRGGGASGKKGR